MSHGRKIGVIGLGYVGLPVAAAFARAGSSVVGFDVDEKRVRELRDGHDRTREVAAADLKHPGLEITSAAASLTGCDFYIVTVPTPIDEALRPDLGAMLAASRTVGAVLSFSYRTAAENIPSTPHRTIGSIALWFLGIVLAVNLVAVFLLEGLHWFLPDDPSRYQLFYDLHILS